MCWPLSLPPRRRGVCAGLSLPRVGGGGGCDDDGAWRAAPVAPFRRRLPRLPQPPGGPGASSRPVACLLFYSGSSDGVQAGGSPSLAAPLRGVSRVERLRLCGFNPSTLQPVVVGVFLSRLLRSAKLGVAGVRARVITCTVSKRRRDREGVAPAWLQGSETLGVRSSLLQEVLPSEVLGPRTQAPGLESFRFFLKRRVDNSREK